MTSKRIPGAKKIAAKLSSEADPLNTKAVAWVRKYKATTNSMHGLPVAENILNRNFTADAPNRKRVSDITYIATD